MELLHVAPEPEQRGRGTQQGRGSTSASASVAAIPDWTTTGTGTSNSNGFLSWITLETAERVARDLLNMTTLEFEGRYADVEAYTSCDDDGDGLHECSIVDDFLRPTKWLHLRREALDVLGRDFLLGTETEDDIWNQPHSMIRLADTVTKETSRWCDEFITKPNVSPWVKPTSLMKREENIEVRFKVVPASFGLEGIEDAVREASLELLQGDGHLQQQCSSSNGREQDAVQMASKDANDVPQGVFTFVVCAPERADAYLTPITPTKHSLLSDAAEWGGIFSDEPEDELDFESFIGFALDLEERLLEEAEEHHSKNDPSEPPMSSFVPISDHVTMIPFHPHWRFACSPDGSRGGNEDLEDTDECDDDLISERMSPYPTILLVRTGDL